MSGYAGFRKKKSSLGTTLAIVAAVHIAAGGGLVWLAKTQTGQEFLKLYKINILKAKEKPPEPPAPEPEPEPPPEAPPPPPPVQEAKPPEPVRAPPPETPRMEAARPPSLPGSDNPFAIGKSRGRFAGYADLLTGAIQQLYRQPPELPDDLEYAVLCQLVVDAQGKVMDARLVGSSGSQLFDQSAIEALSKLDHVRPPPEGMSRTIVVKFYPPT